MYIKIPCKSNRFRKAVTAVLTSAVLIFSTSSFGASIQRAGMEQIISHSELVFEGKVSQAVSRWNDTKAFIHTYVTFEINEVLIGSYDKATLTLRFSGGTVDGITSVTQGSIFPKVGEQGIYFVESISQNLVNPLVGWSQGHFLIKREANGDEVMMTNKRTPILDIEDRQPSQFQFSEGTAFGVKTAHPWLGPQQGMKKSNFKAFLKNKATQMKLGAK
jgi:hypothetical protein